MQAHWASSRLKPISRSGACSPSLLISLCYVVAITDADYLHKPCSPLAPDSCAACALRFLALRSGSHEIERIQLVDLAEGTEMVLEKPVIVVVE